MEQGNDLLSAVTVRLGMAGGCVLGAVLGHWAGTLGMSARGEAPVWAAVIGGIVGLASSWAGLSWLADWHRRGVIVGSLLMVTATAALLARAVLQYI
jgi:hypothetical protein